MLFPVLNDWFDNDFSDNMMNGLRRVNATAPAVNVKEDADKYTMEVARQSARSTICAASSLTPTTSRLTVCPTTWRRTVFPRRSRTAS